MVLGITSLSLVRGNRFVEMMMVLMAGRDAPKNPLFPPISEFVLDRIFEFVLDRTPPVRVGIRRGLFYFLTRE
jgi:hypothetical protein